MNCKKCKVSSTIVNKHFGLCLDCNNKRLHGSKFGKQYKLTSNNKKPLKSNINRLDHKVKQGTKPTKKEVHKKVGKNLLLDEVFYEKAFNSSDHKCEECNKQLPTEFRDDDGNIIARWRYSHIVAKSIAPELRHDLKNINHLCLEHHTQWDFGNKAKMKIYIKNAEKLPRYF